MRFPSYSIGARPRFVIKTAALAALFFFPQVSHSACLDRNARITVRLGDETLSVPDAYLSGPQPKTTASGLWLGLLLTDLIPASCDRAEFLQRGWHNQLSLLLEANQHLRPNSVQIEEMLRWAHLSRQDYVTAQNGCREYKGDMTTAAELYVCGLGDEWIIKCKDGVPVPFSSCNVYRQFYKDIIAVNTSATILLMKR